MAVKLAKVAQLKGHKDSIYDIDISEDGSIIYSAGADGYVVCWDWQNSKDGRVVLSAQRPLYSVYLNQINDRLYAGSQDGQIYEVDLSKNELISTVQRHKGGVFGFIEIQAEVHSFGEDGILANRLNSKSISNKSLRVAVNTGNGYAIGSSDHTIKILNENKDLITEISAHENSVFALSMSGTDVLASSGRDAMIKLWDLKSYQALKSVAAHSFQVTSLAFQNEILLSSSMDKSIRIWNDDLDLLKVADPLRDQGHTNCVNKVKWLNQSMFVSSSDDRSIIIWEIEKIG